MSSDLHVRPLAAEQIVQAYPLVSLFDPELTLAQWTSYASQLLTEKNGGRTHRILTVQTPDSYIYGLSAYWLRPDLWSGSVLEIDNFAAIAMARGRTIARLLLKALENIARESGCTPLLPYCAAVKASIDVPVYAHGGGSIQLPA